MENEQQIIKNLKIYRRDLAIRVGSFVLSGIVIFAPWVRKVFGGTPKELASTTFYPKEKIVYSEDGEILDRETIYEKTNSDSVNLIIYYPPYEHYDSFYQKEKTFDLSSFEYSNYEDYSDIDLMEYDIDAEDVNVRKVSSLSQTEVEKQLEITKVIEDASPIPGIDKDKLNDWRFSFLYLKTFISMFVLAPSCGYIMNSSYHGLNLKNDIEQIKALKRKLKNKN